VTAQFTSLMMRAGVTTTADMITAGMSEMARESRLRHGALNEICFWG